MGAEVAVHVPLPRPLHEARFIERPNRFLLRCALPGYGSLERGSPARTGSGAAIRSTPIPARERPPGYADRRVEVHLADPGRLRELLLPGARVWIRHVVSASRRTEWSAVLVEPSGGGLVSVDTTLPNRLIRRALERNALPELSGWKLERSEFGLGRSRFDFLLARDRSRLALEVKSVTLVEDGVALFPDAVTARGARHVRTLTAAARDGWEAVILFVLQRDDAYRIEAARSIDPAFAAALAEARAAGVRILGRRCRVSLDRLELGAAVPAG